MPRSKQKNTKGSNSSGQDWKSKLIAVEFSFDMQTEFLKWADTSVFELSGKLEELVTEGWKISISWSSYFDCFQISATDKEVGTKVHDKTLVVKHKQYSRLIPLITYVIEVMLENDHPDIVIEDSLLDW